MNDNNIEDYFNVLRSSSQFIEIFNSNDDLKNHNILNQESLNPEYLVITNSRFKRELKGTKEFISLTDSFGKQPRNADYSINPDKFFSNDHLYYEDEGYVGFSDYSIIGKDYSDSGFAPRAVAIHIVYFDEKCNLRIKHFVSDTNNDISNPAGKFEEALKKLVDWVQNETISLNITKSLNEFVTLYQEQRYPGLGYVKKISLKHHFELISRYFYRGE